METDAHITLTGHAEPTDARAYHLLPFTVPEGTAGVTVAYHYGAPGDRGRGGNTLDLGCFDARGPDGHGFRGWSGGARNRFTIAAAWATPGYTAGPLPAGTWHVLLGLYEIDPAGCDYTVTITLHDHAPPPPPPDPPDAPLDALPDVPAAPSGWLRGDLHCHTVHSDGDATPGDVLATARALGLDFLAVTDHNTLSHQAALAALDPGGLILIPGVEVTTYFGHANVWGLREFVEFRCTTPAVMAASLHDAVRRSGLASMNHPKPYGPPWDFGDLPAFAAIEVWNGPWPALNAIALARADALLRTGRRVVFVGGSDMHHYHPPRIARLARPTTWLFAPGARIAVDLVAAMRAGRIVLSRDPCGPHITFTSGGAPVGSTLPRPRDGRVPVEVSVIGGAGATLQFVTERGIVGTLPLSGAITTETLPVALGDAWTLRAQVTEGPTAMSTAEMLAITSPLFFG